MHSYPGSQRRQQQPKMKREQRAGEQALAKHRLNSPEPGLVARLTGQAKKQQRAWEAEKVQLVAAQAARRERLEAEKQALEVRYREGAAQLREQETAEKAVRLSFERPGRPSIKQEQARPAPDVSKGRGRGLSRRPGEEDLMREGEPRGFKGAPVAAP